MEQELPEYQISIREGHSVDPIPAEVLPPDQFGVSCVCGWESIGDRIIKQYTEYQAYLHITAERPKHNTNKLN